MTAGRPFEPNPQTRFGALIMIELGGGAVLGNDEIDAAIGIVICQGAAALFTVDLDAAGLSRNG